MAQHEALALSERDDMMHLLSQKVACGQVTKELASWLLEYSRRLFPEGSTTRFKHGATYVPFADIIAIQLESSEDDANHGLITVTKGIDEMFECRRGWPRRINILQQECSFGFGYQF